MWLFYEALNRWKCIPLRSHLRDENVSDPHSIGPVVPESYVVVFLHVRRAADRYPI